MKSTYRIFALFVFVALLVHACAPSPAAPANQLEKIKANGKLVVGTSADYPPFEFIAEDGSFTGYDMDLIREVGKRLGVEVEIQDLGFDALVTAVQEGKIDVAIAAMAATEERLEKVDFSIAYNDQKQSFLVNKDSSITFADPKDAAKYKVGVQSGTTLETWINTELIETGLMPAENLFKYERADQAGLDLQAGRLDVVFVDAGPAQDLEAKMNVKIIMTDFIAETGQAIALPKGETELKAELDRIIQELINEGFIKDLHARYIENQ